MRTSEHLPRIFQANLIRLHDRLIRPAMEALPTHPSLAFGETATIDQFLDQAAAEVDNHVVNEAAKAFTLTVAAVFERYLSTWARSFRIDRAGFPPKRELVGKLLETCADHAGIDLEKNDLQADLAEMLLVANVVRHGEGPSCERLKATAPTLWDDAADTYRDLAPGPRIESEYLRIGLDDLTRYIQACIRFWGLVDPLPMATDNPSISWGAAAE